MKTPASRRATLTAPRRSSVAAKRHSIAPTGPVRHSLAPRQSFANAPPRPSTTGRSSMLNSMRNSSANLRHSWDTVFYFLTDQKVDFAIPSLDGSTPPSEALVYQICTALVQSIDPNIVYTKQNFAKEFSTLLKFLRYPEKIPSSALTSPTVPHTWNRLLPAMAWVATLVQSNTPDTPSKCLFTGERGEEKDFLDKMSHSYVLWLSQDDDYDIELIQTLEETFEDRNKSLEHEIQNTQASIDHCHTQISSFNQKGSKLVQANGAARTLQSDLTKISDALDVYERKKSDLEKKLQNSELLYSQLNEKHLDLTNHRDNLGLRLENQEHSKEEILSLLTTKSKREDSLSSLHSQLEVDRRNLWDLEVSLTKSLEKVELLNKSVLNLCLELGVDLPLKLNLTGMNQSNLIVSGSIEEALQSIDDIVKATEQELKQVTTKELAVRDRFQHTKCLLEEKKTHLENLERRVEQLDHNLADVKQKIELTEEKDVNDVFTLEQELRVLSLDDSDRQIDELTIEKNRLEEQLEQARNEYDTESTKCTDMLVELVSELIRHKEVVETSLNTSIGYCQQLTHELFDV
ncbi:hypothetical protein P9112_002534 [Eukaryota sp. TZLM1-RC]